MMQLPIVCCASARMALWLAGRQLTFHLLNVALGAVGAAAMAVSVALATIFLPFRGFTAFNAVVGTTSKWLGRGDVALHNLLVDRPNDMIEFAETSHLLPVNDGSPKSSTRWLVRPQPLVYSAVYYTVVRVLLAFFSSLGLASFALFAAAFVGDHVHNHIADLSGERLDVRVWLYAECLAGAFVCSLALHSVGRLAQSATRRFACGAK